MSNLKIWNEETSEWDYVGISSSPKFQRRLLADLQLYDGESLVTVDYIDLSSGNLILEGDSVLEIL